MTNPAQPIPPPQVPQASPAPATIPAPAPEEEKGPSDEEIIAGLKTLKDVGFFVNERCPYEVGDLPRIDLVCWYPQKGGVEASMLLQTAVVAIDGDARYPSPEAKEAAKQIVGDRYANQIVQTLIRRQYQCPVGPEWTIIYIFQDDTSIRLYCLRLSRSDESQDINESALGKTETGHARAARYVLNPNSYQFSYETMPLDTWLTEAIDEHNALGVATFGPIEDDDEDEPETPTQTEAATPAPGGANGN